MMGTAAVDSPLTPPANRQMVAFALQALGPGFCIMHLESGEAQLLYDEHSQPQVQSFMQTMHIKEVSRVSSEARNDTYYMQAQESHPEITHDIASNRTSGTGTDIEQSNHDEFMTGLGISSASGKDLSNNSSYPDHRPGESSSPNAGYRPSLEENANDQITSDAHVNVHRGQPGAHIDRDDGDGEGHRDDGDHSTESCHTPPEYSYSAFLKRARDQSAANRRRMREMQSFEYVVKHPDFSKYDHEGVSKLYWLVSSLQQLSCRDMARLWISIAAPHKRREYPYSGLESTRPQWWPKGVPHTQPDHLLKPQRTALLMKLLLYFPNNRQEFHRAANQLDIIKRFLTTQLAEVFLQADKLSPVKVVVTDVADTLKATPISRVRKRRDRAITSTGRWGKDSSDGVVDPSLRRHDLMHVEKETPTRVTRPKLLRAPSVVPSFQEESSPNAPQEVPVSIGLDRPTGSRWLGSYGSGTHSPFQQQDEAAKAAAARAVDPFSSNQYRPNARRDDSRGLQARPRTPLAIHMLKQNSLPSSPSFNSLYGSRALGFANSGSLPGIDTMLPRPAAPIWSPRGLGEANPSSVTSREGFGANSSAANSNGEDRFPQGLEQPRTSEQSSPLEAQLGQFGILQ